MAFKVAAGELVCVVGPNGSGKTTLIKLIVGLLAIQTGHILVAGEQPETIKAKQKALYLASDDYLPEFLSGIEYVGLLCKLYDKEMSEELLDQFLVRYEMQGKGDALIEDYSHGMRKKVQLIAALMINPMLLVIDEILNGVDLRARDETVNLICKYQQDGGTVLLCTHELALVEEFNQRALVFSEGSLIHDVFLPILHKEGMSLKDLVKRLSDSR